jgi:hypothetical protein
MLFRTFDPYYDDIQNKVIDKTECFICYQFIINEKIVPLQLNDQIFYTKICNCNGSIHKECLDRWFNSNYNCPVCRNRIIKKKCNESNKVSYECILYTYIFLTKDVILLLMSFYIIRKIFEYVKK